METESNSRKKQIIAGLAVLIVIVVIVAATSLADKKDATTTSTTTTPTTSDSAAADTTNSSATLKDGTYTATGGYNSPGGAQKITITVTLKNGVITDTSAKEGANDVEAQEYQDEFIANYKNQVVGKNVSTLKLSRVAGSSLTPIGFNNAIDQIETQAQV